MYHTWYVKKDNKYNKITNKYFENSPYLILKKEKRKMEKGIQKKRIKKSM